eukprot:3564827-Rhodomonas_salina.3
MVLRIRCAISGTHISCAPTGHGLGCPGSTGWRAVNSTESSAALVLSLEQYRFGTGSGAVPPPSTGS